MRLMDLYWFIGTFMIIYLFYLVFMVIKHKELNPNKVPIELLYLMKKYHLDIKKINYRKIMNIIGLISAFDIAFTATFVFIFIKNIYLAILIGVIMLIPIIVITFSFIGNYYKKRGMVK